MTKLDKDWLTEGLIDSEYKKYILLAYIQDVKTNFGDKILYPFLSDLVFHYNNLLALKDNKQLLYENFPKRISKADFESLKLNYARIIKDDQLMQEIEEIINFSLPQFKYTLDVGKNIYENIAKHVAIEPIGIIPLYTYEGYLFLSEPESPDTWVYRYQIKVFKHAKENFRGINTEYIETTQIGVGNTFERLKSDLIARNRQLPNPATYLARSEIKCPLQETLLPITKRLLMEHIEQAA